MTVENGLARIERGARGPGSTIEGALTEWAQSTDPRVAIAGALLAATVRPPSDASFTIVVPESGPAAVVTHPSRGR
jgi:hypothetical protein